MTELFITLSIVFIAYFILFRSMYISWKRGNKYKEENKELEKKLKG